MFGRDTGARPAASHVLRGDGQRGYSVLGDISAPFPTEEHQRSARYRAGLVVRAAAARLGSKTEVRLARNMVRPPRAAPARGARAVPSDMCPPTGKHVVLDQYYVVLEYDVALQHPF